MSTGMSAMFGLWAFTKVVAQCTSMHRYRYFLDLVVQHSAEVVIFLKLLYFTLVAIYVKVFLFFGVSLSSLHIRQ